VGQQWVDSERTLHAIVRDICRTEGVLNGALEKAALDAGVSDSGSYYGARNALVQPGVLTKGARGAPA
jgi:hypothetical protein